MSKDPINDIASKRLRILATMQETIDTMKALLKQQQVLLNGDDVGAFIQSMTQNQDKLKEMEQLMQSLHGIESRQGGQNDSPDCAAMEDNITRSIRELQELEKETHSMAIQKLDDYRRNVRDIRVAKKGIRSYLSPFSSADGVYFDKKK